MLTYSTISDFIAAKYQVSAHCLRAPGCWHGSDIDLAVLAKRLGGDFDLYRSDLKERFRCAECGSRGASFIIRAPSRPLP
jgi:hypothetical protein